MGCICPGRPPDYSLKIGCEGSVFVTLTAGVAKVDITPQDPTFLWGFAHAERTSTGIHDPLFASALFIKSDVQPLILISVDLLMLSKESATFCREFIADQTGVPVKNILISATHTHSGPVTSPVKAMHTDPIEVLPDPDYIDSLHSGIIQAAVEACRHAIPARLAITQANIEGVGGSRNVKDGLRDPEAGILYLQDAANHTPMALSVIYSVHPTVLHEDSKLISADFPGMARQYLEQHLPGITVLYHTGAAGDQSPRHYVTEQTFKEAQRLGENLGHSVLQSILNLSDDDFLTSIDLGAAHTFVDLPSRIFPSLDEAENRLENACFEFEQLKESGADRAAIRTAEVAIFGAEELLALATMQMNGELNDLLQASLPAEVQALKIGPVCLVGFPAEMFVTYGLEIKRRSASRTFVISLANGSLHGYIVTPEATGYEADFTFYDPDAGTILVDTAVEILNELNQE